jgi:DNA-binding transcriptional LysR family regulator
MDIKQLNYFIAIIDNHFNLSQAAKQLYITQPALSLVIKEYENAQNLNIFIRHKNRIVGLTPKGEVLYHHAKKILAEHDKMLTNLHNEQGEVQQKFTIGIPPYINIATFGKIIPRFIKKYPNIEMNIIEKGALTIKNHLLEKKVDFAALLYPEEISPNLIDSYTIQESELVVYVSKNHKWAKKESLTWKDLNHEKMVTFDDSFMIPHKLNKEFKHRATYPNIVMKSFSWDVLLTATKENPDLFTILPAVTSNIFDSIKDDYVIIPIEEPIIWRVTLCCLKETQQSPELNHILNLILKEFDPGQR